MKTLAILQARMSSSRLPGKVMMQILGKPMLLHQIERISKSKMIDHLVVATSIDKSDDLLVDMLIEHNIDYYRGSLYDVLERFYFVAKKFKPNQIVRLTGDCPLSDFNLIDKIIQFHNNNNFDYTSNVIPPTFPDGLDVEVFTYSSLCEAYNKSYLPSHREHVTPYINTNNNFYNIGNYADKCDNSKLRWTVDEQCDFELVNTIYINLYPYNKNFKTNDVYNFLKKHPEVSMINSSIGRNEGLKKSLVKDIKYVK